MFAKLSKIVDIFHIMFQLIDTKGIMAYNLKNTICNLSLGVFLITYEATTIG